MGRQHVDHDKAGREFFGWEVQKYTAPDSIEIAEFIGAGEADTLPAAQAAAVEMANERGGDIIDIRIRRYAWDPELDHEEVRWVSNDTDDRYLCNGYPDESGQWAWDIDDNRPKEDA